MAAPVAVGPYSPALRAGEWVILSGQLGLADGKLVDYPSYTNPVDFQV